MTQYLMIGLSLWCMIFCAAGFMVRDGFPWMGEHKDWLARSIGGACCLVGALLVQPWLLAVSYGLAVLVGFFIDYQHAKGQAADSWRCILPLFISGVSSNALLMLVYWYLGGSWQDALGILLFFGLFKVLLWFLCHLFFEDQVWFYPTRAAAIFYGGVTGAVLILI